MTCCAPGRILVVMQTMTAESASIRESTPQRRRRWTDEEKAATLVMLAESGMSVAAFSRAMDIPEATLYLWRRQACGDMSADSEVQFAEVQFAEVQVVDRGAGTPQTAVRDDTVGAASVGPGLTMALRWPTGMMAEITGLDPQTIGAVVRALALPGDMPCCR